jgi:branched-subunit amino acid aminotransferase/4-amino-4-deoxychorismate lyase
MRHWQLLPGHQAIEPLSNFPTALLYGYSVYTTFRYPLEERWLQAHFTRLRGNAETLGLSLVVSDEAMAEAVRRVGLEQAEEVVIRLTVFPELADFTELLGETAVQLPSRLLLSSRKAPGLEALQKSVRLKTVEYERPLATVKHGGLAEPFYLRRQAIAEGYDDVLFVNRHGHITEASTSNIFFFNEHELATPDPVRDGCLSGITRERVLEKVIESQGDSLIQLINSPLHWNEIDAWAGAFLVNAVTGIRLVNAINDRDYPAPFKPYWIDTSAY